MRLTVEQDVIFPNIPQANLEAMQQVRWSGLGVGSGCAGAKLTPFGPASRQTLLLFKMMVDSGAAAVLPRLPQARVWLPTRLMSEAQPSRTPCTVARTLFPSFCQGFVVPVLAVPAVQRHQLAALRMQEPIFQKYLIDAGNLTRGMVSCTGAQFCGVAMIETKNRAMAIVEKLEQQLDLPKKVRMHWTGCPNSCGQVAPRSSCKYLQQPARIQQTLVHRAATAQHTAYQVRSAATANLAVASVLGVQRSMPRLTGCWSTCHSQAQVGDIGLMGGPAKLDGKAVEGVRIMVRLPPTTLPHLRDHPRV